ncbi:MAG: membrane protein insertion efficiency factor YidD [Buchnera aphidicola (Nurudea shiraii)]
MVLLLSLISQFFIFLILLYQRFISILIVPRCRFTPTCSNYALSVLRRFNLMKGCFLIVKRISKCHPFHFGGYDDVPKD